MTTARATKKTTKIAPDENPLVGKTIRLILERAVKTGASDVHIEPRTGYGVVRQRIDGLLQVTTKIPGTSFGDVTLYLKKLGGLNTAQKLAPQIGRYKLALGRRSYDVQIATLPVMDGERITLHIADAELIPLTLAELGFWGTGLNSMNQALTQPHGLIVVSSTDQTSSLLTLGSLLHNVNSPHLHVASVEQERIYQLPNVNQLLVKHDIGMTFARRLKQTLGSEPNVIMISDVLDKRTARTVIQAANDRQLVLVGVHATDVASSLVGLAQLSNEPVLLASALHVSVSQNLVAKLCASCREAYEPTPELLSKLSRAFDIKNAARMLRLHKLEAEALTEQLGVTADQPLSAKLSTTEQRVVRLWRPHVGGCKACNHTGLSGRMTINQVVANTSSLQATLQKSPTTAELRKAVQVPNSIPLALDAFVKSLRGLIPIDTALAHVTI